MLQTLHSKLSMWGITQAAPFHNIILGLPQGNGQPEQYSQIRSEALGATNTSSVFDVSVGKFQYTQDSFPARTETRQNILLG